MIIVYLSFFIFLLNIVPANSSQSIFFSQVPFSALRVLELSHSQDLIRITNFSTMPNLETLILKGCTNLLEIDPSIEVLDKLGLLNLRGCKKLDDLPNSISNLTSLEILNVSGCSKLKNLPEDLGCLQCLLSLNADGTAIRQLPSSLGLLKNINILTFCGCKGLASESWFPPALVMKSSIQFCLQLSSFSGLCSSSELDLSDCKLSDGAIPSDFWNLLSLQKLDLSGNHITTLPSGIAQLSKLRVLRLGHCHWLRKIPNLPLRMQEVDANNCISLEMLSTTSCDVMESTSLENSLTQNVLQRIQVCLSLSQY